MDSEKKSRVPGDLPKDGIQASPRPRLTWATAYHTARLVIAGIFIYASYDKILHPQAFAQAVYNYHILPDALINVTAVVLPWLELLTGLLLAANCWVPGAAALTTGMLCVFLSALVFNQIRGLDVACGCFSTQSTHGAGSDWWTVGRDSAIFLISAFVLASSLWLNTFEHRRIDGKTGSISG